MRTGLMLSVAGRAEQAANQPAAAQTGRTLSVALRYLHKKAPDIFPSENLRDYRIVNAHGGVHHKGSTGRTEATWTELLDPGNLKRVDRCLRGLDTVVALGDKPDLTVRASGFQGSVLSGGHPSLQHINRRYASERETPEERAEDRLRWTPSVGPVSEFRYLHLDRQ
jgi:hypothetical protein